MIKPFYAIKSNPDPVLLSMLKKGGAGFDCASAQEIKLACGINAPIIFANPCKTDRDIDHAQMYNVDLTVVDSVEEVEKLALAKWKGSTLVRIAVEDSGSLCRFSEKFGASIPEVKKISVACKRWQIPLKGVSFHVGSGCHREEQYEWALSDAHNALRYISEKPIIDIGGGFVANAAIFSKTAAIIRKNLIPGLTYIAEPGRFFSARSHDLLTKVIGVKPGINGVGYRYTIDESLYGQFSSIPFDHAKPKWELISDKTSERRELTPGIIFGRTCDSMDLIERSDSMPRLHVGDWLLFKNMGAYTSVTASEFNGFPKPQIIYED
jgi:ornithine decarboxylase